MKASFLRVFTAALLALCGFVSSAFAAYPERPITMIVPWGAGGGTDATARIIGALLEKELGQPVTVGNRIGGSGVVDDGDLLPQPLLQQRADDAGRGIGAA